MGEAKVCSKCGVDVSHAARFKDASGNRYCAGCAKELGGKGTAAPTASGEEARKPDAAVSDAGYALADDEGGAGAAGAGRGRGLDECPGCGGMMIASDVICTKCGFNKSTGQRVGIATPREGGGGGGGESAPARGREKRGAGGKRRLTVRDDVQRETRAAYIKPVVITAVCLPIALLAWGLVWQEPMMAGLALAQFAVMYVASFAVFFGCSVVWIGFDEPLGLAALRLLAVCAITEIARAVTSPLPGYWQVQAIVQIVIGFVFVASLMTLMEMEKEDAIIVALICWAVRFAILMVFRHYAVEFGWIE